MPSYEHVIYFFVSYIVLFVFTKKWINSAISKTIVLLINLGIVYSLKDMFSSSNLNHLYILMILIGNTIFLIQSRKIKSSLMLTFNLQFLLGTYLLTTNILFFHILALSLFIRSFSLIDKSKVEVLFDYSIISLYLVFSLLIYIWSGSLELNSLSSIIKNNYLLISFLIFLNFYPSIRLLLHENDFNLKNKEKCGNPKIWLWYGIVGSYFIKVLIDLDITLYIKNQLLNLTTLFILVLLLFVTLRIESTRDRANKLILIIITNQVLFIFNIITRSFEASSAFVLNTLLIMAFVLLKLTQRKSFKLRVMSYLDNLVKLFIAVSMLAIPMTPWFALYDGLVLYFIKNNLMLYLVCFVLIFGIRFRQNLFYIPVLFRVKSSD